jgi:hypothetical protein
MATQTPFGQQNLPFDGRIGAVQNAEDPVVLLKNALHAARRKHKKALKFAQMKEAHHGVDISARQEHAADRCRRRSLIGRREFVHTNHLLAQIGRSAEQKPNFGVERKDNLRLRAWASFHLAVAQTATVRTMTIPLGKAAPGCGSEDFYAHSRTPASLLAWRTECLELGVGVGADFAVEVNLFVPRGGPFHGNKLLLESKIKDHKSITWGVKERNRHFL